MHSSNDAGVASAEHVYADVGTETRASVRTRHHARTCVTRAIALAQHFGEVARGDAPPVRAVTAAAAPLPPPSPRTARERRPHGQKRARGCPHALSPRLPRPFPGIRALEQPPPRERRTRSRSGVPRAAWSRWSRRDVNSVRRDPSPQLPSRHAALGASAVT